jgi:hypothetical protein
MGCKDSKPERDAPPGWAQFREESFQITVEEEAAHARARRESREHRVHLEKDVPDLESKLEIYQGIWADIKAARVARESWQQAPTESTFPESHPPANNVGVENESEKLLVRQPPPSMSKAEQQKFLEDERERVELLTMDPSSWESFAKEQLWMKAEDRLSAAMAAELEVRGKTARLARLKFAIGALYDFRSNTDMTGQQQALSLEAAKHCREALAIWRELTTPEELSTKPLEAQERLARMSETLVLMGRGLCNFALDGDGPSLTASAAFDEAEKLLKEALQVSERIAASMQKRVEDASVACTRECQTRRRRRLAGSDRTD